MPDLSDERLIFVVGSPRSGTTLLQNMLCHHPDISSAPETRIFSILSRSILNDRNRRPLLKAPFPEVLKKQDAVTYASRVGQITDRTVSLAFAKFRGDVIPVDEFILRTFDSLRCNDAKYFIEKTPLHIHYIKEIQKTFPNAHIVNIYRDPRATVHSMDAMFGAQSKQRSIIHRSLIWERSVSSAIRHNLLSVYYENLVANPELELRQMLARLEIDQPEKFDFDFETQSRHTVLSHEVWKERNFDRIDTTSVRKYELEMKPLDRRMVEVLCETKMKRLGYPVQPASMTEMLYRWKNKGAFLGSPSLRIACGRDRWF